MNRIKIMEEEWDYLIILDACRFDYFEQIWKKYFKGELKGELTKKISVGSSTREWRDNSFKKYYDDVIYISSNPYINSNIPMNGFLGSEHFNEVYDIWKEGWDEKRGTVLPETVTNATIDIVKSNKNKRIIIHYVQPHVPYLSLGMNFRGFPIPDPRSGRVLSGVNEEIKISRITNNMINIFSLIFKKIGILGNCPDWKLREFLRMDPVFKMDAVRRKYGNIGLRKAYMSNLEIVIQQVLILLNYLSGKIVITADHGELLGECQCYNRWGGSINPYLIEIPWLVLEKRSEYTKDINSKMRDKKRKLKK